VRSTASCLADLAPKARPGLDVWAQNARSFLKGGGSTWNAEALDREGSILEVDGDGRAGLVAPPADLDCGNSGTSMRLLSGLLAGAEFRSVLVGDESLSRRPMERVAAPLRQMGGAIDTTDGHAPVTIAGGRLRGIRFEVPVPSAQVKGAVLLAGLAADGTTTLVEMAPTRDHTERALAALGAPVTVDRGITVSRFQHEGFEAAVPGDPSSAAFLVAAAALTGSSLTVRDVGLNPSRLRFLDVMGRMGVVVETVVERDELGEPVGSLHVMPSGALSPVRVDETELPLVIDEVPILALLAAHAPGDSWFLGAGELRVKESDRIAAIVEGIRSLGGHAGEEGEDLVVAGGGLGGGTARADGDHRMAMSFAVAALAASGPSEIDGMEAADVSFPGFVPMLRALGAGVEVAP
jgi:3-phosphoshikimate 1-carboxyvinyltransferase